MTRKRSFVFLCRSSTHRWQLIELAILGAKVGDVGLGAHRPTGRTLDKFARLELASMLIEVFAQPGVQCAELAYGDLTRDIGMCFDGGSVELRAQNVADSVALKSTTDAAGIPMDVLQATISAALARIPTLAWCPVIIATPSD